MKRKISIRKHFWGRCRSLVRNVIPETSSLYRLIYLNTVKLLARKRNKRKDKLFFQFNVVDSCNLNCAGCTAFSPLCDKKFADLTSFERDIKALAVVGGGG